MWKTLGIDPTDDARQVRAAYARKLKAIDREHDPAAFIALRKAYERALAGAGRPQAEPAREPEMAGSPREQARAAVPEPPAAPEWLDDLRHIDALVEGTASREAIFDDVQEHLRRVLTHPDMLAIDHAAQIEQWAAHRILSGLPRTNALIGPCIDYFRWDERIADWDCPPAIHQVMQRRADNILYATLLESDTRTAKVFRMLADPAGRTPGSANWEVQQLLERLRVEHPTILLDLPEGNIARWDALAERQMHTPIARANRWLDARLAPVARLCRRLYLDRIAMGIGLVLAMLMLVVMMFGVPITAFVAIRWIGQLAEKFGMLFGSGDAE